MDDLQFRRNVYADPSNLDEETRQAIKEDASREQFVNELTDLDRDIKQALAIDVPSDLTQKLILKQTFVSHRQQQKKKRVHLALAASVAFALGLSLNVLQFSSAYNSLSDHALAHIHHEDGEFANTMPANVTLASLNNKMATFNGSFSDHIGELISAEYCRFDGMKSLHLVFKGETSPVTVFVIPQNDKLTIESQFADEKFRGRAVAYQRSNIVIIGDENEELTKWQESVETSVRWST
ncbi:DUF3379 domain-containing protein [Thalassotalea sp. LPB0316]|uniref:DUF3379 family protein n=1 Tax=Thalassotalea sp. LPB0316 TaxID=2769490 RepID=UPI0018663891|nr:DUF3379 family protein [Thalassotalea sp. LPB0316]QOL24434.1 DUF3379 domain-containing protein [Thalassotalea sp. LPB0316]